MLCLPMAFAAKNEHDNLQVTKVYFVCVSIHTQKPLSVIIVYRVARSSGCLLVDGADVFQNYDWACPLGCGLTG